MLAIVYLALMVAVGDAIGRRFIPFLSVPHRWASAFLCGLLFSSWFTYLVALASASSTTPMFSGNIAFFIAAIGLIYLVNRGPSLDLVQTTIDTGETEFKRWDLAIVAFFLIFAYWLMFRTFAMTDGNIAFGHHQFPDFGSTVSIMQSFALGHNFPTEYPHFSGERIRYHFLFYFQAGNLEYLGLNPVWANNLLSMFSLTSMLVLVMTLGSVVFRSRIVGRIGAALFFFHGSLAFIPFLIANPSIGAIMDKLSKMIMYLNSGLPYRGEDWGVWSQNVFLNQRHFTSSIGLFLLVVIYLLVRYRETLEAEPLAELAARESKPTDENTALDVEALADAEPEASEDESEPDSVPATDADETTDGDEGNNVDERVAEADSDDELKVEEPVAVLSGSSKFQEYGGFVFCGLILGLLPLWNGPVYLSAAVVLAMFLILFPLRKQLIALAVTSAAIGLPQVLFLTTGGLRERGYSMFRWGFVIDDAGFFDVLYYNFFTFGFKWVLLAIALYFASGFQRRFLGATFILFPLTYCFRFSEEVLANHKFLNVWLIIANVFAGYALVKLWNSKSGSSFIPARIAAIVLAVLVTIGGAIDLVPVWNSHFISMKYNDDQLVEWVKTNTDPGAIFLSQKYINHQILLAGRRLFYGDPYYAWSAGYDTPRREVLVKTMFESRDPAEMFRLLKDNHISYIAIDDMIRRNPTFIRQPNEDLIAKNFELVFTDDKNAYANMKIYKVPETLSARSASVTVTAETISAGLFDKTGSAPQFSRPRGIAVDSKGNIYVADTGNALIHKFDADGKPLLTFGEKGEAPGQLKEPNGVAIDEAGQIYVTDAGTHKMLRFKPDGQFDKEWTGPPGNFYGPRDLTFGPNKLLYIIDQGGTRICKFDPASEAWTTWGSAGSGESQFNEPTGIAIGGGNVFVADVNNARVQIFDLEGRFVRQFGIDTWRDPSGIFPDIAYDDLRKLIYVGGGKANTIVALNTDGTQGEPLQLPEGVILNNPTALAIHTMGKSRRLLVLNTTAGTVALIDLAKANK